MGTIRVLPEHVANKISAGEVVERPASIVKELIENSLDAGADKIEIAIKHGGKSLIRVADNGSGMSVEDAQLAVQRHATSKIVKAEDLEGIQSFGFRGEALPSIAAVSRFVIQTRTSKAQTGTELIIEGGHLTKAKECSAAQGTVVEIRDLFFNTPARRKFLKQDSTEYGHILDGVTCLALANLDIHFTLKASGKVVLDLLPTKDLSLRARAVFGDEWAEQVVPVKGDIPHARLLGLIGKPALAAGNRTRQFFFVNKRWVKAYGLAYALQAGFHGFLMQHQFPAAILFLDLDPRHVDVNVHPTKQQVRLSHEPMIKALVEKAVSQALKKTQDLAPQIRSAEKMPLISGVSAPRSRETSFEFAESNNLASAVKVADVGGFEGQCGHDGTIKIGKSVKITKILGQVHRTYILAETAKGYALVDQHAAHERVMFEALMESFGAAKPASQRLLMEEILELHPRQVETLSKDLEFLTRLGFEVEPFGERSFVVRAIPAVLKDENPLTLLMEFVDERETGKTWTRLKGREEDIAAVIACKRKSVKAADPLTFLEMEELLRLLGQCENPFNCPHGRPSFVRVSMADLEKQFKRKV